MAQDGASPARKTNHVTSISLTTGGFRGFSLISSDSINYATMVESQEEAQWGFLVGGHIDVPGG